MGIFTQSSYDVRLEWGPEGVRELGPACAVLIVVDVLSFSTTVDLVVSQGGQVRPHAWRRRGQTVTRPASVQSFPPGRVLDLPSPNGATLCSLAASTSALVMAGCLRNARSVASAAHRLAGQGPVGVIPAGERWGVNLLGDATEGGLRPCIEDHLGAGAIVHALLALGRAASPEALLAATAYHGSDIAEAVADCSSGRELAVAGHGHDLGLAAATDVSTAAPLLRGTTLSDASVLASVLEKVEEGMFATDYP